MTDFAYDLDKDGIATITWDVPGRSMNVLTLDGVAQLSDLIDRALADPAVRGVVLTSAKADFAGGMDLNLVAQLRLGGAQAVFDNVMRLHGLLRRIERAGRDDKAGKPAKPIVAALPGTALGIGLELPLACHRIIAAEAPGAKIGLPEIKVGIFPGAGGTTRLARKLGVMAASPFLLEGKLSDPKAALAAGLIDDLAPPDALLSRARAWILAAEPADLVKPWDAKGYKFPGGAPYHPAGYMTFVGAAAVVNGQTMGVYPAAKAMLSAIYEGALVPFDNALRIEARHFTSVLMNPCSTAMIRSLFVNKTALEKGAHRPAVPVASLQRVGVIGAGMMGAGIAHVCAKAGLQVVLVDQAQEAAERGKAQVARALDQAIARRKSTERQKAELLDSITPTAHLGALGGCDLVIEAVFEDPKVKAEVLARAEAALGPDAILASNTSTLPISGLARACSDPARFVGIHFFSPVEKMALVEIIRGKETGDKALALALDLVRRIGKTPIVVQDARFFYANRCIIPYLNEGLRMLSEGVAPALIEQAARLSGLPVGPLQLVDETSIDLGLKIARATREALGSAYADAPVEAVLAWMADQGRLGRKVKAGFYAYDADGRRSGLWPGLAAQFPHAEDQPDLAEVQHRLLLIQVIEAVRALEQGVLSDIREGDVGAILGWGFAPWSGGPFGWLDITGLPQAVALCEGLASRHGPRFAPPRLIVQMAAEGQCFYPPPPQAQVA